MMDIPASLVGWGPGSPRRGVGSLEAPQPSSFSIKSQFSGANVFLTGCTGYIGGLVLESMLRTTDVAKVYVLLRPKKNTPVQERCDQLLQGPTFHMIRDKPELLCKVVAVGGDLSEDGLGLSAADREALAANVDILIHSAADIRLEAPIQETMRANYVGTERVLALALQLRRWAAFCRLLEAGRAAGAQARPGLSAAPWGWRSARRRPCALPPVAPPRARAVSCFRRAPLPPHAALHSPPSPPSPPPPVSTPYCPGSAPWCT
jgi:hypothetical protein